jgi:hypothetical protein
VTHEQHDPFAEIEARRVGEWRNFLVAEPDLLEGAATLTELPKQPCDLRSTERQWPKPPAEQAFHGIAGEIVRTIEPHTEADPSALLFQFLGGFGNLVGRTTSTGRHRQIGAVSSCSSMRVGSVNRRGDFARAVCDGVREDPEVQAVGGAGYVSKLPDGVYDKAPIVHYAEIVRRIGRRVLIPRRALEQFAMRNHPAITRERRDS